MDFKEFLKLCKDAIRKLLVGPSKLQGKRPNTLKAAAVHYLARKKGLPITLNNLYLIYGVYQESIFIAKKIFRELDSEG